MKGGIKQKLVFCLSLLGIFSLDGLSGQNDPATCDIRLVFEGIIRGEGYVSGKTSAQRLCVMKKGESLSCCIKDEGRPLGFGGQKLESNHPMRLL